MEATESSDKLFYVIALLKVALIIYNVDKSYENVKPTQDALHTTECCFNFSGLPCQ